MHIAQATSIPLVSILDKLGYKPLGKNNHEVLYRSPFSKREHDKLRILLSKNVWVDDFQDRRGNTVTFSMVYLQHLDKPHTAENALAWIAELMGIVDEIQPITIEEKIHEEPGLTIESISSISDRALLNYLAKKGITQKVANRYLREIRVYRPEYGKSVLALGLKNEDNGWEVFNPYFQTYRGTRGINFIQGHFPKTGRIHIFKDIFDFLSVVMLEKNEKRFEDDVLILNSLSFLSSASPYIKDCGYQYACSWMGNDNPGKLATKSLDDFFKNQPGLRHIIKNPVIIPDQSMNVSRPIKCCA